MGMRDSIQIKKKHYKVILICEGEYNTTNIHYLLLI